MTGPAMAVSRSSAVACGSILRDFLDFCPAGPGRQNAAAFRRVAPAARVLRGNGRQADS